MVVGYIRILEIFMEWKIKKGDREMISLIGLTLLFGTLYLIWKCWYMPKVEKFIRGEGWR